MEPNAIFFTGKISVLRKLVGVFFLALALNSPSFGQRYLITPSASDTMIDFAPVGHYSHFIFNIQNLTDGELLFHWQQLYTDIPAGWIVGMCDYGHCYGQLGLSGTMDTLPNTNIGIFALGVDPQNISGQAVVRYALWEEATPAQIDTITWIITSNNASGIFEVNESHSLKNRELVYVIDKANTLQLPFVVKEAFVVYQSNGQVIYQGQKNDAGLLSALSNLSAGSYFIRVLEENNIPRVYRIQLK